MTDRPSEAAEFDREVVQNLLDTGAVNFDAIGAALAKHGPRAALIRDDDGWENFCLTMKIFIRLYRHPPIFYQAAGRLELEELTKLREVISRELHD